MNKEIYNKIKTYVESYPSGVKIVNMLDKISKIIIYLAYFAFLLILAFMRDIRIIKVVLIPASTFIIVSLFRKIYNAPRPYELLDIDPIIHKETQGNSFPSRHVFSTFIIAMTLYYISAPVGIILMLVGVLISVIRVIGGVHFPKDVLAGALIGIVFGILGWNLFI